MKFSASLVGGAVLFGAVACKEKPKGAESVAEEKSAVEKVVEKVKETVAPITESSLSDEERAAKLGFADQAHFTREFRRVSGVTPGRFRKTYLNG